MSDLPPSESAPPLPSDSAKQKAVCKTLVEFISASRASAPAFARLIASRKELSELDLTQSMEMIRTDPRKLGKALELVRASAKANPQPTVILHWCEQVVRAHDDSLQNWGLDPAKDVTETLSDLVAWAFPRIQAKGEASGRRIAELCLLIGINVLFARRGLSTIDVLRSVPLASKTSRGEGRSSALNQQTRKLLARASIKQLTDLSRIAALFDAEIATANGAMRDAIMLADRLRVEKEQLEKTVAEYSDKLEQLEGDLAQRDLRNKELSADIETLNARALDNIGKLKARFRRQIGETLMGLVTDAWDALDTDPPHPKVARERIEVARETIQGELEWLDKSSD
jgi:hypothetical protein